MVKILLAYGKIMLKVKFEPKCMDLTMLFIICKTETSLRVVQYDLMLEISLKLHFQALILPIFFWERTPGVRW